MKLGVAATILLVGCGAYGPDDECDKDPECLFPGDDWCEDDPACTVVDGEPVCARGYALGNEECVRAVDYDAGCSTTTCYGADDTDEYKSGSYHSYTCTWHCARFEGQDDRYVTITFVEGTSCWEIDSTYESDGILCE